MKVRCYSDLSKLETFDERFQYLKLGGHVGHSTFGSDRYLNQQFYASREWQIARRDVIVRDNGCDLGIPGYDIHVKVLIHHMNPMTSEDIVHGEDWIFDPEFLITTTPQTHNAIHYGDDRQLPKVVAQRSPNDTRLW